MHIIISPAKKLDFESANPVVDYSHCEFLDTSKKLITGLQKLKVNEIAKLMKLSKNLAELNFNRYQEFKTPFSLKNSKQAALAFKGDTYIGLKFETFKPDEVQYAQNHLHILSGLYGILKPLDLIQPYRLEMGTNFGVNGKKNLYEIWKETLTEKLNTEIPKQEILVNLASKEYFSAIDFTKLKANIITPVFKEKKNDVYKIISFNAKRARGMMSQYILKNQIKKIEDLKKFNLDNYQYSAELSNETEIVFVR